MEVTSNLDRYSAFIDGGKGRKNIYLRLEPRETPYVVRLVSDIYGFRQHWSAFRSISKKPVVSPAFTWDEMSKDDAWAKGGWEPSKKYAAVVINRETGELQVLQSGAQVFNPIFNFIKNTKKAGRGVDPAGNDGPDWIITVEKVGGKTTYECSLDSTGPKSFTKDELEQIGKWPSDWQTKYIKVATSQEISDLWNSLPDDQKMAPPKEDKYGNRTNQPKAAVPAVVAAKEPVAPAPQPVVAEAEDVTDVPEDNEDSPPSLF